MPYYIKDPKRDPNFDNHPDGFAREGQVSKQRLRRGHGQGLSPLQPAGSSLLDLGFQGLGFKGLGFIRVYRV